MHAQDARRKRDRATADRRAQTRRAGLEGNQLVGDSGRVCDICRQRRGKGGLLETAGSDPVWVCDDCQRQAARRVDHNEAKGG